MINDKINDKRKALGRGLESLLPSRPMNPPIAMPAPQAGASTQEIPVDSIDPNPYQTRRRINEAALEELTDSIRASGVIQPVVLRPTANGRYQLVAGERRWHASKRAGKATIPAVVRQISDEQAMEITIIENLQREDLNPMEQARAFERLSREFALTQEQIALKTGKERASIANFLRLLKLPAGVQAHIEADRLSLGHGKVLMMLQNEPAEMVERVAAKAAESGMSVRELEELVVKLMGPPRGATTEREQERKDPNVRAAEEMIQRALGCKVTVKDRLGKGKIILEYASLEEFDRVVET